MGTVLALIPRSGSPTAWGEAQDPASAKDQMSAQGEAGNKLSMWRRVGRRLMCWSLQGVPAGAA